MDTKMRFQKRNAVLTTAAVVVGVLLCGVSQARNFNPGGDQSPVTRPAAGDSGGQANPLLEPSGQATVSAKTLLGKWRCDGSYLGSPATVVVSYTAGNYRTVLTFQGHQIIVGGTYKATPAGDNSLSVSYKPSDWQPREICSGPGGVGGNCVPVDFQPTTEQLFFRSPDTFQTELGTCQRLK
jgi:hypothetical protein